MYTKAPLALLAFAFFSAVAISSAHSVPAVEDYAAFPVVEKMSVSPDGKMVAFLKKDGDKNLLLAYSLEDNAVVHAFDVSETDPRRLYFLDHNRLVIVASQNKYLRDYKRKNLEISTAFALDFKKGSIDQLLTPGDVIYTGQLGLGRILGLSDDGKRVFMPAYVPRMKNDRNPNYSLLEVELASVKRPRIVEKGSGHADDYFVDGDGKVIAQVVFNDLANYHAVYAYHDGKEVEIFREDTPVPIMRVAALTPDRKSLVIIVETEDTDHASYYTMSLQNGEMTGPLLTSRSADVAGVLTDINRIAYGVRYSGFTPTYQFFDESLTQRISSIQTQFPGHSVRLADWSADWKHLVMKVEGTSSAGDYYLFSEGEKPRFLAAVRPNIAAEDVNPIISYQYKTRDGVAIPTILTIPLKYAENPSKMPAVMLPHGGPEAHDSIRFDWMAQALASRGYLVIQPQFRGSSGFGTEHRLAGRGEWGKLSQNDITDGLQALAAQQVVDPNRVCIMGASYGGFAALAGGAFTPELYKCVVSINGVTDVRQMLKEEKSDHGRGHWALDYWSDVIARGDTSKETLDSISPANAAANFKAPVLLLHGDKDTTVRDNQSKTMYKALKKADKDVTFVKLKGEDHYLSQPATRRQMLEESAKFIESHIGTET